jgi:Fur family transcriptional regulator, zinc uptake regulator
MSYNSKSHQEKLKSSLGYKNLCIEKLKASGSRITKARLNIIECIGEAKTPMSAPQIYESLLKNSQTTIPDKVSVYRVLDTLLELNLVHRVNPSGDYLACSHLKCTEVYHVISRCNLCNLVQEVDVPNEVVSPLLLYLKKNLKFVANTHLLHIDGSCSKCST